MPLISIHEDDLSGAEIRALLKLHLADAYANSPPGSVHALDLDGLRDPKVTFWSVWDGQNLLGCGAIKELNSSHGEIKSMRTHADHLRKGIGATVLEHLIDQAKIRGYERLSLETGSNEAYAPARALYERFGFIECGPFADYEIDDFSFYMDLIL
jgi:putative acetyltransferase